MSSSIPKFYFYPQYSEYEKTNKNLFSKEEALKLDIYKCLICESENTEIDDINNMDDIDNLNDLDFTNNKIYQKIFCNDCNSTRTNVYKFDKIETIKNKNNNIQSLTIQEYSQYDGKVCFCCGEKDIIIKDIDENYEIISVSKTCNKCNSSWTDIYKFYDIVDLEVCGD